MYVLLFYIQKKGVDKLPIVYVLLVYSETFLDVARESSFLFRLIIVESNFHEVEFITDRKLYLHYFDYFGRNWNSIQLMGL
jgi:hypothetical protein